MRPPAARHFRRPVQLLGTKTYAPDTRHAVGAKQIKSNAISTAKIKNGAVTGAKIQAGTLGTVPSAAHAGTADSAGRAGTAASADTAVSAGDAQTIAGICFEATANPANGAFAALVMCATRDYRLPSSEELFAYDIANYVGESPGYEWAAPYYFDSAGAESTNRCVTPATN